MPGSKIFALILSFLSKMLSLYELRHLLIKKRVHSYIYNDDGCGKRNHILMHYKYALSLCPRNHVFNRVMGGSYRQSNGSDASIFVMEGHFIQAPEKMSSLFVFHDISGNHFNRKKIFHPVL